MISVNRREGESVNALIFRFSKKIRRSGIAQEVRRRRFRKRSQNKLKKRLSAFHRLEKEVEKGGYNYKVTSRRS
jgi:ribosomal protein S21